MNNGKKNILTSLIDEVYNPNYKVPSISEIITFNILKASSLLI